MGLQTPYFFLFIENTKKKFFFVIDREQHTLALLSKFKSKLETLKEKHETDIDSTSSKEHYKSSPSTASSASSKKKSSHRSKHHRDESTKLTQIDEYEDIQGDDWLAHQLCFEDTGNILAKDASTKKDDWYDVYDPRNPINKRKRGAIGGSGSSGGKKTSE